MMVSPRKELTEIGSEKHDSYIVRSLYMNRVCQVGIMSYAKVQPDFVNIGRRFNKQPSAMLYIMTFITPRMIFFGIFDNKVSENGSLI